METTVRGERVVVTIAAEDGLSDRFWVFRPDPRGFNALRNTLVLAAYGERTRPTRRHKFRGDEARSWFATLAPHEVPRYLRREAVELPEEVIAAAVAAVRDLVTFDPTN